MSIGTLEQEVQDTAVLNVFRAVNCIRDYGVLQDIIFLAQQTSAMPRCFEFDVPHARSGEYASSEIFYTADRLERSGKIREVRTGPRWFNAELRLPDSEQNSPVDVTVEIMEAIGKLKPEDIGMIARATFFAGQLQIDFAKRRLTNADVKRLHGALAYRSEWIRDIHAAYRTILASKK